MRIIKVKPRINKKNGQINIYLPRKKISKKFKDDILKLKSIKIKILD